MMETLVCLVCIVYLFNFLVVVAKVIFALVAVNKEKKTWNKLKAMTDSWAIPEEESDFED